MIDRERLAKFLYQHGYFWKYPSGYAIRPSDLETLELSNLAFEDAVRAWQESDVNFDVLSRAIHNRRVIPDGGIGPVTEAMLYVPRCSVPDFPQPGVSGVVRATGVGSWPSPGCDWQYPDKSAHSIRVAIGTDQCPATVKAYLNQALEAVRLAYAEVGLAVRYLYHTGDSPPDCEIRKRWEALPGSVIGWNEFPSPGTCNQTIEGRFDTGYTPGDWRMWANLECHETGHGVGLQHGNGGIMNPSIVLVWPLTWRGSYSYANLKRWFGGEPLTPTEPPSPPPAPNPPDHNGLVIIDGVLYKSKFWRA